jgi:hypothetical protein
MKIKEKLMNTNEHIQENNENTLNRTPKKTKET